MSYVYRGKIRDVTKPLPAPEPVRHASTPGPKPKQRLFDATKCGTYRGYQQHARTGVPKCQPCKTANADYSREYEARVKAGANMAHPKRGFDPARCGDRNGYLHHWKHKVPACDACKEANAKWTADYRANKAGEKAQELSDGNRAKLIENKCG